MASEAPTLPRKPNVEVQQAWRVRQGSDDLAFDRNSVLVNFLEERVGKFDDVLSFVISMRQPGIRKPEPHVFKEVEPRAIGHPVARRLILRAEKDGSRKDPLETFDDAAVMAAVFGEMEEIKHFCGGLEMHDAAFLAEGQRCNPDWDEAVLAVREAEAGMASNFEKELSIAPKVGEPMLRRTAKRDSAEDKWP